jgi:hypothetical protein
MHKKVLIIYIEVLSYTIKRWGLNFNTELTLTIEGHHIQGTFIRNGLSFDWDIEGTYQDSGEFQLEIDGAMNLGVNLVGTIRKK